MKTKAEIVKALLEEKKIDIDEAIVLLTGDERPVQYFPCPVYPLPYYPYNPPGWPIYISGSTGGYGVPNTFTIANTN